MNGDRYLLDTNIVIAVLNQDAVVEHYVAEAAVYLSGIVLGELYFGAYKSSRVLEYLSRLQTFAREYVILGCDDETAAHYGQIKYHLGIKGHPIPENDIWIAALAVQHDLILASRDEHFQQVEGLRIEAW